jgi:vacuolar-type H+-ATPase subunit H
MSKSSERQAWTKFVEEREREREAKRPRAKKRANREVSQAELEAGDLVTEHVSKNSGRTDAH